MTDINLNSHILDARLFEIGLYSDNSLKLAEFYKKTLEYEFVKSGDILRGSAKDRRISISEGPSRTLSYASFTVPDANELDALAKRLCQANIVFSRITVDGFEPKAISFSDPDGNVMRFGIAMENTDEQKSQISKRVARMQHVVFASLNTVQLLEFYTGVVGFVLSDRVNDDQGALRSVFMRCNHEHHSLAIFSASENRLDHHCYEAEDWNAIRDWADHFAEDRIPLKWGPGRHGPGNNLFLFIHDPDGNWLEISAELEHVAPDRPIGDWLHEEYTLNSWGLGKLRS